jgi:hypothetical protein
MRVISPVYLRRTFTVLSLVAAGATFAGAAAPTVHVISPLPGSAVKTGDVVAITWSTPDLFGAPGVPTSIALYDAATGRRDFMITRNALTAYGNNTFAWRVPTGISRVGAFIRVESLATATPFSAASSVFSITSTAAAPTLEVVFPNKGEILTPH